jgi:hypothetical protein
MEALMTLMLTRRTIVRTIAGAFPLLGAGSTFAAQGQVVPARPSPLPTDLVLRFVQTAHADLESTRQMLDGEPRLIRATWDWGGGDFETALGGAAHMGRRDIATLLLARGATLDLFAAAMLGQLTIVRAALETSPSLAQVRGPHGIPLIAHAKAGGPDAAGVLEYIGQVLARRAQA